IGPAAGSTAAQKSAGGRVLPLTSKRIQYVIREPYNGTGNPLHMLVGLVDEDGHVTIRSKMRQAKIFLDGHHNEYDVEMGEVITLRRSSEPLTVLGLTRANGGASESDTSASASARTRTRTPTRTPTSKGEEARATRTRSVNDKPPKKSRRVKAR